MEVHAHRRRHPPHGEMLMMMSDVYPFSIKLFRSRGAAESSSPTLSVVSSPASTLRLIDIINDALSIVEARTDDVNQSMSIIGEKTADKDGSDSSEEPTGTE
jgi:hypothetical protein